MDSEGFAAAMARVDVIAYTPTEFFEEKDVTIGRCRDLVEKYAVTWVNVVGLDDRTAGELETLFGAHPLALDDARNQSMAPPVDLEEDIIEQPSGQGISRLHSLRSDLVRLRSALRPQREMFAVLGRLEIPVFRNETRTYLRDVQEHTISALDTLDANRETVASLMEVQATLASNQMNEVIKVLTVIFTITLPIAIVSSAFGMNVTFYGFNRPEGFYVALALMAVPTVLLSVWMHRKGWL